MTQAQGCTITTEDQERGGSSHERGGSSHERDMEEEEEEVMQEVMVLQEEEEEDKEIEPEQYCMACPWAPMDLGSARHSMMKLKLEGRRRKVNSRPPD